MAQATAKPEVPPPEVPPHEYSYPAMIQELTSSTSPDEIDDLTTWDVLVGRISGTWDRANLKVQPFSQSPERFKQGARFCIEVDGKRHLLEVISSRASGHSFILDCGLKTSEEARDLRGAQLFIHPSMRPALPEGQFYVDELLGLRVETEDGQSWGEIEEVLETPAHDVYVTPQAMIPSHEEFIVRRDFANGVVVVRDVPGLRDAEPRDDATERQRNA